MRVAVVGSYGVGLTMFSSRFPEAGETLTDGRFSVEHGGKGSNQAICAARLGADVTFLTAVGKDSYGDNAQQLWKDENVDASAVNLVDEPTMAGVIIVDDSGENRIIIAPGALETLQPFDVEAFRPSLSDADVVVVSLEIPIETAVAALQVASEDGATTVLNPAPAAPLPDDVWPSVDIVTPNATEAATIARMADNLTPEETALQLNRRTGAAVVMTLGGQGVMVAVDGSTRRVAPVKVNDVVDTTGAGDSFTGALSVGIANGLDLDGAVRFAAYAGAHAVTVRGVVPALPNQDDLRKLGYQS